MNQPQHFEKVKKFYFLDYFYVLIKSISTTASGVRDKVFEAFKLLKQEHRLGESKYKKKIESEEPNQRQIKRYIYTFEQVITEARQYELIREDGDILSLTQSGIDLMNAYDPDALEPYNRTLLVLMENYHSAFGYLIEFLYGIKGKRPGLLILPSYSPLQLNIDRSEIRCISDVLNYSRRLTQKLHEDASRYLGRDVDLTGPNGELIQKLTEANLLSPNPSEEFRADDYNKIMKRVRDHWINHFLRKIYGFDSSVSAFDIWVWRGKQIGIIHATEFYPDPTFNGRLVYPTSVLLDYVSPASLPDFECLFRCQDGRRIFQHRPNWDDGKNQERFIDSMVAAYLDLRRTHRSYFVNLPALRELVCYNMKISETLFAEYLAKAYRLNLSGQLRVGISLEVDRLPDETNAMYLKQDPVKVDGRFRNIIGIDVSKG